MYAVPCEILIIIMQINRYTKQIFSVIFLAGFETLKNKKWYVTNIAEDAE